MKISTSSLCAWAVLSLAFGAPSAYADTKGDKDRPNVENMTLTSRQVGGTSPDETISDLFDERGNKIGFSTTDCTVIKEADPRAVQCHGSYVLEGRGEITWENANRDQRPPHLRAITGGTGEFCEARGQIRVIRYVSDPQGGEYQLKVIKGRKCPV
ncbi:hypothetical protein [Streptomyces sp. NPDC051776]|uniref:hypothetical protein n=1 Tax=Streptomyces sp. NPDC051776 TaxID=3155414 RepID=UPI003432867F